MKARAVARAIAAPAIMLVVYLVLRLLFAMVTEGGGLVTPSGSVSPGVLLLALAVLALRMALLFVIPAWIGYRVVVRLLRPRSARRVAAGRDTDRG